MPRDGVPLAYELRPGDYFLTPFRSGVIYKVVTTENRGIDVGIHVLAVDGTGRKSNFYFEPKWKIYSSNDFFKVRDHLRNR